MSLLRGAIAVALGSLLISSTVFAADVATSSSGAPLHWETDQVAFTLAMQQHPDTLTDSDGPAAAAAAVAAWHDSMAAYGVEVSVSPTPGVAAHHAPDGINTIRWELTPDDPDLQVGLLGRTFTAYQTGDGVLIDTDIVFDAVDFTWSHDMSDCVQEYDLDNALTHEVGHALGLAHSVGHPEATMFATGDACETTKRDIAQDDLDGLATLYAPPPAADEPGGGCSTSGSTGGLPFVAIIGAAMLFARRRRVAALAVLAAIPATASAGLLRRVDVPELDQHAELVVRGHVTTSEVTPELETDSTVVVDECLSAAVCPASIVVRRHGGERDGVGLHVDGEAELTSGTDVVLFVRQDREHRARVVGGVQGVLRVTRDGKVLRATRDLRGHEVKTDDGWTHGSLETFDVAAIRQQLRRR
ncbi:MAG TPA: matrixin family metalloprotease [Kofleriaceae bacterium]|jgi:uncharacterized protein (TIGR03382 family)